MMLALFLPLAMTTALQGSGVAAIDQRTETVSTSYKDVRVGRSQRQCWLKFKLVHTSREISPGDPHHIDGALGVIPSSDDTDPTFELRLGVQRYPMGKREGPTAALFMIDGRLNSDDFVSSEILADGESARFMFKPNQRTRDAVFGAMTERRSFSFTYTIGDANLVEQAIVDLAGEEQAIAASALKDGGPPYRRFMHCAANAFQAL